MKTLLLLLFIFITAVPSLYAQDIRSIDIEKAKESYPNNTLYSSDGTTQKSLPFAELNGVFYFNADDGIHGNELYRTDGTAAGTYLVKDIYPGSQSSNVNDIVTSGNHIYFSATSDASNSQLWTSDGTAAGTHLVPVVNAGAASVRPTYITDVNGTPYFVATLYFDGDQLWKTDGTEAGTILVADFTNFNPFYGYSLKSLTNVNGKVFFTALNNANTTDPQLYVTDGTPQGTSLVKDINPFGPDYPCNLTAVNNSLYFCANDGTGSHLWVSDGTEAGTHAVNNVNGTSLFNSYYYNQTPYAVKNNVLYFQAYDASNDNELYKYNTASATSSITLVKDIIPGPTSSYPNTITNVSGTLYFIDFTSTFHQQLWKSDGTNAGTILVKDIAPNEPDAFYYGLTNAGGTLAFAFGDSALGYELWKSDGTSAGTVLVKDIFPGIYSSFPNFLTYSSGKFLFNATDVVKGAEIWTSDGTAGGTTLVKDINQTSSTSSFPRNITYTGNNKTFFRAGTEKYGFELYVTNGTDRGTKLVSDVTPGTFGTYETLLTRFQNQLYFVAYHNGYYLSKSDGTAGGTSFFFPLDSIYSYSYGQIQLVATDNLLYFTVFNYVTYQQELWRSDGTASGTYAIKTDFQPYYALAPVAVGNTLFFSNYEDATGQELWKSDGTAAGTALVKDIYPGGFSSAPFSLYNFQGKLYFAADVGFGPFLFTSDGTAGGTKQVKAILLAANTPFAQANGKLFFNAYNTVGQGYELYATDGTGAGTKLVKDINKGPANSSPYSLVNGNRILYFQADNGKDGAELWTSDGKAENTHLVKDITAGINSTYISERVNVNDKLFFTINDSLWQSDATEAGTHPVTDATVNGANAYTSLTAAGDRFYFSAFKYSIGQELFTAKVAGQANDERLITEAVKPVTDNNFVAKLLSNPVNDQVRLLLSLQKAQQVQVVVTDASGKAMLTDQKMMAAGEHTLSYTSGIWLPGIYFIKVTGGDGSFVLIKAIK